MRSQNYIVYHGIHVLNLNLAFLGVRGGENFLKTRDIDALREKPTLKSKFEV